LFELKKFKKPWGFLVVQKHDIPTFVCLCLLEHQFLFIVVDSSAVENFAELEAVVYDMESEAACGIRSEYLMVPSPPELKKTPATENPRAYRHTLYWTQSSSVRR
jgi:hypothetical protein